MANPKKRHSKSRTRMRRANWRLTSPQLVRCSNCGEFKAPHRVCGECGTYNGRQVIAVEK
jgi:large subunit ribosomal protein L32